MARVIWKGAVSFGLVHIPVSLIPATNRSGIDFDWLDKRSMDRVGYKRVNKATGKEIAGKDIVKGVEYEKGRYVVLSEDEIRSAYPEATKAVEIVAFVEAGQIPLLYIDTPYYLAPERRGEKVYALLREALASSGRVGLANVVLHTKQHLAVLMPIGDALVLNTLRWANEVRSVEEAGLDTDAVKVKPAKRELDMAKRLIEEMSEDWDPSRYEDSFEARIMELVKRKAEQGKLEAVGSEADESEETSADVIDLTELLKRSLEGGGKRSTSRREPDKTEDKQPRGRSARKKTG